MTDIKRPKWDKPTERTAAGSYGPDTIIQPDNIVIGMTAEAKHKTVDVIIKITKVENKHNAEGTIITIDSKTESVGDLSVGDLVFITLWDIEHLDRSIK
jgi:hypothetical protein